MSDFKRPLPQEDFNGYINGEWQANNKIPDDQNRWGSFMILREDNLQRCKDILESDEAKDTLVGRLYAKAMTDRGGDGAQPKKVLDLLQHVATTIVDAESYLKVAAELFPMGIALFTHICKSEDSKDPTIRVPHLFQAGLGLPDVSYYTEREDLWGDYKTYINELSKLYNLDGVLGEKVFDFEKEIATQHLTRTQRRDPDLVYNKKDYKSEVAPLLKAYFDNLNGMNPEKLSYCVVENPKLLEFMGDFLSKAEPATLRAHALFHVANKFATIGNNDSINLHFDFNGKKLNGQKVIDPLWKRSLATVEKYIGDELGKIYVEKHFPAEKRKMCNDMVNDLKDSLGATLNDLEWMSKETKVQAVEKLNKFGVKIGVPEEWHSIEHLWEHGLKGDVSLADAVFEWYAWDWEHQEIAKFYTPPEKKLWHMTPQTVNAYYHPEMNEIVFPAGILQPPFFGFDHYEQNIGAIGVVIGHEMTHGFDDQGRKYNSKGELNDWWTEDDSKAFDERAKPVEEHYGAQLVLGKPVNGKLTLGENIADIGGLKLALRAAKKHFGGSLTKEQQHRFFESYALIWRMLIRDELALKFLAIDPHSPCHLRINAALAHIDEFYEAYDIKEGDAMYLAKDKRMQIW